MNMKTGEECKVCGYTARMDSLECLECGACLPSITLLVVGPGTGGAEFPIDRIIYAWERVPNLRFGQLLNCSIDLDSLPLIKDEDLAEAVEKFVAKQVERDPNVQ